MGTSYEELYNEYKNGSLSIFDGDEYYGDMLEAMDGGKHEISLFNRFFEKKCSIRDPHEIFREIVGEEFFEI